MAKPSAMFGVALLIAFPHTESVIQRASLHQLTLPASLKRTNSSDELEVLRDGRKIGRHGPIPVALPARMAIESLRPNEVALIACHQLQGR
jgi:hypothetical protein